MTYDETLSHDEAAAIAEEAYVYFFPMLMGYRYAFASFLVPSLPSYRVPLNVLGGEPVTLDHTFKDVISPNADTPYSMAALDLRAEPMVLSVPEVKDRYYVMQFEDLFGMNEHFVGTRATGTDEGTYLLTGPQWNGETPDGIDAVLPFETDLVFLIGRTQLFGPDDTEAAGRVMSAYDLRSLSAYLGTDPKEAAPYDWPVWNDDASRDERFIAYASALLPLCQPTHPDEVEIMERFARIGIRPGHPFDIEGLEEGAREALKSGVDAARENMAKQSESIGEIVNGWTNTDPFGDREFYAGDYMLRAVGAMVGWGGNDKIEAFYPMARVDADGVPFDGANRYLLKFDTLPPAKAFWSVTMYNTAYDGTAGFFVENSIGRYLINSTTGGLVYGEDGSLAITIQRNEPTDPTNRANWLPAPDGKFYLVLRIYHPASAALDATWSPPPVVRL
ncbi:MAG: DUF1254 domain-containing protein [Actinomycetia bacterium]|nr:DUF1254 domain-containing protein [Actinomycetes bacterium]